jgi:hypothetical protein
VSADSATPILRLQSGGSIVPDQIEDSARKPPLKLLELNLIAHFTFDALQIPLQLRKIR